MKVRILEITAGIPLEINKIYKVNFETETHYVIFNNDIWCGIFKSGAEIIEKYKTLSDGQIAFNI